MDESLLFILLLITAAIFIIAATHISLLILSATKWKRQADIYKRHEEIASPKPANEAKGDDRSGAPADLTALIHTIKAEGRANRAEEEREDDASKRREWLTISLLALTVFVIGWQVNEMIKVYGPIKEQAAAMKDQATIMKADQRPWVKIANAEPGFLDFGPTTINFSLVLTVENVGKTPATGIEIRPTLRAVTQQEFDSEDIIEADTCSLAKRDYSSRATGLTLFPGDKDTFSTGPTMLTNDVPNGPLNDGRKGAGFAVMGCIDYFISSDRTHGQTGFRYYINARHAGSDVPYVIYAAPGRINAPDLMLTKALYGNYGQ